MAKLYRAIGDYQPTTTLGLKAAEHGNLHKDYSIITICEQMNGRIMLRGQGLAVSTVIGLRNN
jgi:hypothetical protein